jgi:hypothetical protein
MEAKGLVVSDNCCCEFGKFGARSGWESEREGTDDFRWFPGKSFASGVNFCPDTVFSNCTFFHTILVQSDI